LLLHLLFYFIARQVLCRKCLKCLTIQFWQPGSTSLYHGWINFCKLSDTGPCIAWASYRSIALADSVPRKICNRLKTVTMGGLKIINREENRWGCYWDGSWVVIYIYIYIFIYIYIYISETGKAYNGMYYYYGKNEIQQHRFSNYRLR